MAVAPALKPRKAKLAAGHSYFSSPLTGEDQGGGEQIGMLPPPLTPPTRGGELKGGHHGKNFYPVR